jgi:electron transport complex protein RnfB
MTDLIPTLAAGLIERIDALLPQTQCGKCGHPGCQPYAQGIATGEAINKCPPGGAETIGLLADLLGVPAVPLDRERGETLAQIAYIREAECIGCTKCIQACPVDAIVGAAKQMHTVLVHECTGCDLCVAPCPVDCIDMHQAQQYQLTPLVGGLASTPDDFEARAAKRSQARRRFKARTARLERELRRRLDERAARAPLLSTSTTAPLPSGTSSTAEALKKARIAVAMSRAQLTRSLKAFGHPPVAEQAARLVILQQELEATERELDRLTRTTSHTVEEIPPKPDIATIKRAKVRLAMALAAVGKARNSDACSDQVAKLEAELRQAEAALTQLQAADAGRTVEPGIRS